MLTHHFFDFHASRSPQAPCIVFQGNTLSYADMSEQVARIASGLEGLGVGRDDRVAMLCENCPDHVAAMLASSKRCAVFVPLNYRLSAPELIQIITDADVKVLFVPDQTKIGLLASIREGLPDDVVVIARGAGIANHEWDTWISSQSVEHAEQEADHNQAYLQIYTSGTTGNPKGVVTSHGALIAYFVMIMSGFPVRPAPGTADLVCAPNFHISGTSSVIMPLLAGGSVVLHASFDPRAIVGDLENYPITSMTLVPAMLQFILSAIPDIDQRNFPNLQMIGYGGSPITPTLLERAMEVFGCGFLQAYGMTETCGTVTTLSPADHERALQGELELLQSCGREQQGVEIKIMDKDGQPVAVGETGELWVRSDSLMDGYYKKPEQTQLEMPNGWLRTGDSGYKNAEGYVFLRDRVKDMVISGGENIYPVEVENVLAEHPAVEDVSVIGIPDERYGESLMACITLSADKNLDLDEMIAYCRGKLAGYKIPRQLQIIDEMPRNPSGKILKKVLREPYWR